MIAVKINGRQQPRYRSHLFHVWKKKSALNQPATSLSGQQSGYYRKKSPTKQKTNNPDCLGRGKLYCKKKRLKEYKKDELSLSKASLLQKAKLLTMTNEALQGSFKKVNFSVS